MALELDNSRIMDEKGERYDRGDIERIFKGAVPDAVYAELLRDPGFLNPRGVEGEYTVVFTDVAGATDRIGSMPATEQISFLRECLELSEAAIVGNGGYVENFIGDATLALFGAIGRQEPREQALAACRASLEMVRSYARMDVSLRVGVHFGRACIGNAATRNRPYYAPAGAEINYGARLEGEAKRLRHSIAVSAPIAELVRGDFRAVPADVFRTRLLDGSRTIYALIAAESELSPSQKRLWDRYEAAYAALERGEAEEAVAELRSLKDDPEAIPFLDFAYDRARSRLIDRIALDFARADRPELLRAEAAGAVGRLFAGAEAGIVEPQDDGTWRFVAAPELAAPPIILAPGGDIVVWLKGVQGAAPLSRDAADAETGSGADRSGASGPPPVAMADIPFGMAAPLRFRSEVVGALFVSLPDPDSADLELLAAIADRLSRPFGELRMAAWRERYREKASAEERLSAANWELEAQSLELQRALTDIKALNASLEARVTEQVERLERAFKLKRYLPPDLVEEVLDGRKRLEPSFERRKITVFFSDVRGFTAATDALEPEELARLLNEYLSAMSEIAFRHGGTIDKFRGDGMMILFGAPERLEPADSARRCAGMAAEMCRATEKLKAKWDYEGYDWDIGVRIGINTGYATVGEFGCEDRMDFTAIGSEVNLASRLENACETGEITISHATYALVRDTFPCSPRGEVQLKGIARPVRIYELLWRD